MTSTVTTAVTTAKLRANRVERRLLETELEILNNRLVSLTLSVFMLYLLLGAVVILPPPAIAIGILVLAITVTFYGLFLLTKQNALQDRIDQIYAELRSVNEHIY